MKITAIFIAMGLLLGACSEDSGRASIQWKKLGLDGKKINELRLSGSALYAATTTGLFKKDLNTGGDFALIGFENKNVEALELTDDHGLIVSLVDKAGMEEPSLHKTANGGETWQPIDSDFGGGMPEPIYDLEVHPADRNILYATGAAVVAKSVDGGVSWDPVYGEYGGMATGMSVMEINPNATDELWAGGQGAIENGYLLRSQNGTVWDRWDDLVDNPTVVKEIAFSAADNNKVFVGWEGALLTTPDGGANWETLIRSEENRFYFGIGVSNRSTSRIYAGGWLKTADPQPLVLYMSNDEGDTWSEYRMPHENYGGIFEMLINSEEHRDILYLGLDQGGVYEVGVAF